MSKKRKPRRPPRRTPYESALEHATTRLEKAVDERSACLLKIDSLNREIPYLQGIVEALAPPKETENEVPHTSGYGPPAPPAVEVSSPTMDQETYLQRFLPRPGRVTSATPPQVHQQARNGPSDNNPDPDEFLADSIQGTELLG